MKRRASLEQTIFIYVRIRIHVTNGSLTSSFAAMSKHRRQFRLNSEQFISGSIKLFYGMNNS
jgi:hypothetical protein